jgi:RNase H-like domain found in reverse transcriptase/Reverse transcriptase (RNA-dependent DNA polymerase)/Integrase core domain/Integrase zinc binding domain/gag-polyprotein putative aspartyl protease
MEINGQVFRCYPDSGASVTTLSLAMARLAELNYQRNKIKLQGPTGGVIVTVGEAIVPKVRLHTINGPIEIHKLPILIVEENMPELLLGDDVLQRLGINIQEQINELGKLILDFESGEMVSGYPPFGGEDPEEIREILEQSLENGKKNGLTEIEKWKKLLFQHVNTFRLTLSHDPPAKVDLMNVHYDLEKAKKIRPVRIPYTREQEQFMDYYTSKLLAYGYCRENKNARYVSECLVIPKVDDPKSLEDDWRLVVNLKRANAAIDPIYWPLPTFEELEKHLNGAKYFISLDLKNGFWQVGLHPDVQELFSFATHRTVLTPCRMPQGCSDSSMFFTSVIMETFREKLYHGIIPCLDDLLIYAQTVTELFDLLQWVLEKADIVGLKFSPKKLQLLAQGLKWCGRLITPHGIAVDPGRIAALVNIPVPETADQLMMFINASNWIRAHIVNYATGIEPLRRRLEQALQGGKRTKRRAKNVSLEVTPEYRTEFALAIEMIKVTVTRSYPRDDWDFLVFTDASECSWGAVLFQTPNFDPNIKLSKYEVMEPLHFLSGVFKGSQTRWSTPEKEAYAVISAVEKLRQYLVRPHGFIILTDHRNFIFSYAPESTRKLNVRAKLDRWSLKLDGYKYRLVHISGLENLWSDMLSRWGTPGLHSAQRACRLTRPKRYVAQPIVEPLQNMAFPSLRELQKLQRDANDKIPSNAVLDNGLYRYKGKIWIPETAKTNIMVVAHYGISGHNGAQATLQRIQECMYWLHMEEEVKAFVQDCILCRCSKMIQPTRIHLGIGHRPARPNESLHFDFFSVYNDEYLLVMRDAFSRFVLLIDCATCDTEAAVEGLLEWIALFGIPERFFSDQGPHFRNKVMQQLAKKLNVIHDFSTPYCVV